MNCHVHGECGRDQIQRRSIALVETSLGLSIVRCSEEAVILVVVSNRPQPVVGALGTLPNHDGRVVRSIYNSRSEQIEEVLSCALSFPLSWAPDLKLLQDVEDVRGKMH